MTTAEYYIPSEAKKAFTGDGAIGNGKTDFDSIIRERIDVFRVGDYKEYLDSEVEATCVKLLKALDRNKELWIETYGVTNPYVEELYEQGVSSIEDYRNGLRELTESEIYLAKEEEIRKEIELIGGKIRHIQTLSIGKRRYKRIHAKKLKKLKLEKEKLEDGLRTFTQQ